MCAHSLKRIMAITLIATLAACQTPPPPAEPIQADVRFDEGAVPVAAEAQSATASGTMALAALQQDFQQVPNPDILGYVYPHFSGSLPVPGYYTAFPLRDKAHYAQLGEGYYPGVAP